MEILTEYLNSKKNKFLDEDKNIKFCSCGNRLYTDEEIRLGICKECK